MEYNELEVRLEKSVEDKLILKFDELEDCVINLEEPQADDLKFFFDSIFEYIAKNEKL